MTDEADNLLTDATEPVARLISDLRIEADRGHFQELTEPAVELGSRRRRVARWHPRVAAAIAASLALLVGFGGTAWAAQGAGPGDMLYGLDRALEVVGIGDGGTDERLDEVRSLVEQRQLTRGLEHAAAAVSGHPRAESALSAAADRTAGLDAGIVQADVNALLDYLSVNAGSIDGGEVAALAQAIRPEPPVNPPAGVPPVDPPTGAPPVDPPAGVPPVDPPAGVPPVDPPAGVPPVDPPAGVPPVDPPAGVPPVDPPTGVPPVDPPTGVPPVGVPPVDVPRP